MIHEVDEALRRFVKRDALPDGDVDVAFEAPTKDWASRRTGPVVDLYLYDIREDTRRREYGELERRDEHGIVEARFAPPRWFKLSYLVTAWTQRPEDEHRLLSVLLACFLRRDSLPVDLLVGGLAEARAQIPYTCALPPPQDRALSDVWSALGGELKPSLDLVLIAPFDLARPIPVGPPVEAPLATDLRDLVSGGVDQVRPSRVPRPGAPGADEADLVVTDAGGPRAGTGRASTATTATTSATSPGSKARGGVTRTRRKAP